VPRRSAAYAGSIVPVSVDPSVPVYPIDVELYDDLVLSGALCGRPVELVDGVFVEMSPEGDAHIWAQARVGEHFVVALAGSAYVACQSGGVQSGRHSVPEPDLYVARRDAVRPSGPPRAARTRGVLLVVEVSNTSRAWDLGRKRRLYAAASIPDYWVIDLVHRKLVVHREPAGDDYATVTTFSPGDAVAPLGLPVPPFDVAAALASDGDNPNACASSS